MERPEACDDRPEGPRATVRARRDRAAAQARQAKVGLFAFIGIVVIVLGLVAFLVTKGDTGSDSQPPTKPVFVAPKPDTKAAPRIEPRQPGGDTTSRPAGKGCRSDKETCVDHCGAPGFPDTACVRRCMDDYFECIGLSPN